MREVFRGGEQLKVVDEVFGPGGTVTSSPAPKATAKRKTTTRPEEAGRRDIHERGQVSVASWHLVESGEPEMVIALLDQLGMAAFAIFRNESRDTVAATASLERLLRVDGRGLGTLDDVLRNVDEPGRSALGHSLRAPVEVGSTFEFPVRLSGDPDPGASVVVRGAWVATSHGRTLIAVFDTSDHVDTSVHAGESAVDIAESYRALAEVSPDIILVHQDGRIVYANPAANRYAKCPSGNCLVGMPILDFLTPRSQKTLIERLRAIGSGAGAAEFAEETAVAFDGTEFDIEATSIATTWGGRPAFQAVARVITERKEAERKLRSQAALVDAISEAVIVADGTRFRNLTITSWSRGAQRIFGTSPDEVEGQLFKDVFKGSDNIAASAWRHLLQRGSFAREADLVRANGERFPAHISVTLVRDDADVPTGCIVVITDVTDRKASEAAHKKLEDRHTAVVEALEEGVIVFASDGTVEFANAAAERILHIKGQVVGAKADSLKWDIVNEEGDTLRPTEWPSLQTVRTGRPCTNVVCGISTGDGIVWISVNSRPLASVDRNGCYATVCSITDVTETKNARESLAHAATHDSLTGLPNRSGVEQLMKRLSRGRSDSIGVIFIDLDSFKYVNDSLGHTAGDEVLSVVAKRLSRAASARGFEVGRLAGDEFVVVCPGIEDIVSAATIAEKILERLSYPMTLTDPSSSGHTLNLTASAGVAVIEADRLVVDGLVCADLAMYAAKQIGGNRVEIFDTALREKARERLELREDLCAALLGDQFRVVYQPIVNQKAEVTSYEALLRWEHPTRGDVPPGVFIPAAEEAGLIVDLGAWVLRNAAEQAAQWRAAGCGATVSVNLSPRQICDQNLLSTVREVLVETGLPPGVLFVEVTESSLIQNIQLASAVLSQIKELGIGLAIDDFGTGYSSLSYLDQLPFDVLKVDRSFVSAIRDSESDCTLVSGIVSLAHSLGLLVVAEGVETKEQADVLGSLCVDLMQGYLYGRPGAPPA